MTNRTITGNIYEFGGGSTSGDTVTIYQREPFSSGGTVYQSGATSTTADGSGNWSISAPVPSSGSVAHRVIFPSGDSFDYYVGLGDGSSVNITTLITATGSPATGDIYEPALGNPASDGYALTSTAAGVRSWASLATSAALTSHTSNTSNPHSVTAAQVGAPTTSDLTAHTGLSTTAHGGILPEDAGIVAVSAGRDLATTDAGKILECNGTFTLTCPNGLDAGFQCALVNVGSGTITIAAATTLQSDGTQLATQYTGATVYHRGSNVWLAMGRLT